MTDEKKDSREKEEEERNESSRFKIDDRRSFTSEGDLREAGGNVSETRETSGSEQPTTGERQQSLSSETTFSPVGGQTEAPPVDFSSFLISLATTALLHLGEIPDPATGEVSENLEAGKQMIEIIALHKEKTRGNLEDEETRLLEELL